MLCGTAAWQVSGGNTDVNWLCVFTTAVVGSSCCCCLLGHLTVAGGVCMWLVR